LLKLYGPLLVHVCGSPHKFKVSGKLYFSVLLLTDTPESHTPCCCNPLV
jgi:hypothetical protein